jgi:hypothetical protein
MNVIELDETLRGDTRWTTFAAKLEAAMSHEYQLDGVTVALRELTAEEAVVESHDVLSFNQDTQRFEFALSPGQHLPAAWKVADRIDGFLNPDPEVK